MLLGYQVYYLYHPNPKAIWLDIALGPSYFFPGTPRPPMCLHFQLLFFCYSNITAGTVEQIQAVIDAKLVPILVLAIKEAEIDVKQEAIWAVTNLAEGGTAEQILYLTQQGCLPHMIALVRHLREQKLIIGILDGLENIIEKGADLQKVCHILAVHQNRVCSTKKVLLSHQKIERALCTINKEI